MRQLQPQRSCFFLSLLVCWRFVTFFGICCCEGFFHSISLCFFEVIQSKLRDNGKVLFWRNERNYFDKEQVREKNTHDFFLWASKWFSHAKKRKKLINGSVNTRYSISFSFFLLVILLILLFTAPTKKWPSQLLAAAFVCPWQFHISISFQKTVEDITKKVKKRLITQLRTIKKKKKD